jgi:predicted lipid-binding transport protein (Tim44 family)
MNGFPDILTVAFLVVAVVIFLRLRSVLGRRTGNERPPFDPFTRRAPGARAPAATDEKVISLPARRSVPDEAPAADAASASTAVDQRIRSLAPEGTALSEGLKAIAAADRDFDPDGFLRGARGAYEMIVTAFAEGDRKTLKPLLGREVYDGFVAAISQRETRLETIEFKFVGIDKAEITEASLKNSTAQVTVRFLSKLISATRDKDQAVIDGDPVKVSDVTDIWTFARETASRDPNWKLIATESVE